MTITLPSPCSTDVSIDVAATTEGTPTLGVAPAVDVRPALHAAAASADLECQAGDVDCGGGPDPILAAVGRQADTVRRMDPQAWLFAERARYARHGVCDPYAQLVLLRAGLLPQR